MKKLFTIVIAFVLYTSPVQGMMEYMYDTAKGGIQYVSKTLDPGAYVNHSHNDELLTTLLKAMSEKSIEELSITSFKDREGKTHPFEYTMTKRVAERLSAVAYCIHQASITQDRSKQTPDQLLKMVEGNRLGVTDLYWAYATRAMREQKMEIDSGTGSLIADVYLHKFSLLPESDQSIVISALLREFLYENKTITLEQQRKNAEIYFLSLSEVDQEQLIQKRVQKKSVSITTTHTNKQMRDASPSSQSVDSGNQKKKVVTIVNSSTSNDAFVEPYYDGADNVVNNELYNAQQDQGQYDPNNYEELI